MTAIEIKNIDFEKLKKLEWLSTNEFSSYSSSTILGLNTENHHGIFVSSSTDFKRIMLIKKIDEEIFLSPFIQNSAPTEKISQEFLKKFEFNDNTVKFHYVTKFSDFMKTIKPLSENDGFEIEYKIKNKAMKNMMKFSMNLFLNEKVSSVELINERTFGFSLSDIYTILNSDKALCFKKNFFEKKKGKKSKLKSSSLAHFSIELMPLENKKVKIIAISSQKKEKAFEELKKIEISSHEEKREEQRILSSGIGASIFTLFSTAKTFIVKKEPKLTIISGYPYYGEIGRDAMVSLPGLCLITGRFQEAEKIFENFLNNSSKKGVPSGFSNGKPLYEDIDTTLWLIDRLYLYMHYIGEEKFKNFLHTYWWNLKDILKFYFEKEERDGLLINEEKTTWMSSLKRKGAVEIQGLWYNALKIMELFSKMMDDHELNFSEHINLHEKNFLKKFWIDSFLKDTIDDNNSFRPNQIIVLSLPFNVIPGNFALQIIDKAKEELLTPYGLRTLSKNSPQYDSGEKFNGAAFPWLLGPFIKAYVKFYGREKTYEFIKILFEKHLNEYCLGTISEFFDSENFEPKGAISYSCSVAELLRTYFEDILGRKNKITVY